MGVKEKLRLIHASCFYGVGLSPNDRRDMINVGLEKGRCKPMTDYERGYQDGLAAAAKVREDENYNTLRQRAEKDGYIVIEKNLYTKNAEGQLKLAGHLYC